MSKGLVRDMSYHRENGEWVCPTPAPDDIDYYLQKGAPHCDDPVVAAEDAGYAPALGSGEVESPLKCYKLDEDKQVIGNNVFINGKGLPEKPSKMMQMQLAVNNLNPNKLPPGVQPGDVEAILSWVIAAIVIFIIVCTFIYYAFMAYSQPHGEFWSFVKKWALKWTNPRWWFCAPAAQ